MSDRRNALALAIMASTLIAGQLEARGERDELAGILAESDTERVPVRDADGVELGKATLCGGDTVAKVTDDRAFLAWVKTTRPDMIREVVDKAYKARILKDAGAAGEPVDTSTGEVIPGVDIVTGTSYVKVAPNAMAKERMAALITQSGLLQLTEAPPVVEPRPAVEPVIGFAGLDDEEPAPW